MTKDLLNKLCYCNAQILYHKVKLYKRKRMYVQCSCVAYFSTYVHMYVRSTHVLCISNAGIKNWLRKQKQIT